MILTTIGFVFGSNSSKKMFSVSGGKKDLTSELKPFLMYQTTSLLCLFRSH